MHIGLTSSCLCTRCSWDELKTKPNSYKKKKKRSPPPPPTDLRTRPNLVRRISTPEGACWYARTSGDMLELLESGEGACFILVRESTFETWLCGGLEVRECVQAVSESCVYREAILLVIVKSWFLVTSGDGIVLAGLRRPSWEGIMSSVLQVDCIIWLVEDQRWYIQITALCYLGGYCIGLYFAFV